MPVNPKVTAAVIEQNAMDNVNVLSTEDLAASTVLIVGGGPVGLLVATALAHYGVASVLVERNESTTKWPKMDLTNGRSMEILKRLGLADDLRTYGVSSHIEQPVLFSTGLSAEQPIAKWPHPSVSLRSLLVHIAYFSYSTLAASIRWPKTRFTTPWNTVWRPASSPAKC